MITEKVSPIRRGNLQDIENFLNLPKNNANSTRQDRVASSHLLVNELLKIPKLECQSNIIDDDYGYSENYFFYTTDNKDQLIVKLSLKCCDQWQTYTRSIYKPSTLLEDYKFVQECKEKMSASYKEHILNVVMGIMKIAQQGYTTYTDGDGENFIFCIEHNRKFSKLTLEVQTLT